MTVAKRICGKSGLVLPILGVGCWQFGGGDYWGALDQAEVNAIVRRAVALGVNYFDTAEAYNEGRSEAALGAALKDLNRAEVIVGTKISPSNVQPDVLPRHCEQSLKRLATDYIDLYMVHWPITPHSVAHFTDHEIPCPSVEDAFATLHKLQEQGKIRHIGVSNFGKGKLDEVLRAGVDIAANQLPYNLLARAIEIEILPHCLAQGVGVIGYFGLLQGVLSDKWQTLDEVPPYQRRTRHFDARQSRLYRHGGKGAEPETQAALDGIRQVARECGLTTAQLALKWAMTTDRIACVLVGTQKLGRLEDNVQAVSQMLSPEVVERLNALTQPLSDHLGPSFDYYQSAENDRTV